MRFRNMKKWDKVMYVVMMALAMISLLVLSYFILYSIMSLANSSELAKILIDAKVYTIFYKILSSLNTMFFLFLFLVLFGAIPYLLISCLLAVFFIMRYGKYKGKKAFSILLEITCILVIPFLLVKGISTYPLTGEYEIAVNAKVEEIQNEDVKSFVKEYLTGNEYIDRIEIKQGFPDDYNGYIIYQDGTKKTKNIFLSDTETKFIEDNAEDKTNEHMKRAILFLSLGDMTYLAFVLYLNQEFRKIAKYQEEMEQEKAQENRAGKIGMICILGASTLILVLLLFQYIPKKKQEIPLKQEDTTSIKENAKQEERPDEILYQRNINQAVIIRVKKVDNILAQREIVVIEKSTDGGKTYTTLTPEGITIHKGTEFVFIKEMLGFFYDPGLAGTNRRK